MIDRTFTTARALFLLTIFPIAAIAMGVLMENPVTDTKRIPVTDLKPHDVLVENGNCMLGVTEVIPEGAKILVRHDFGERRIPADRYVRIEA